MLLLGAKVLFVNEESPSDVVSLCAFRESFRIPCREVGPYVSMKLDLPGDLGPGGRMLFGSCSPLAAGAGLGRWCIGVLRCRFTSAWRGSLAGVRLRCAVLLLCGGSVMRGCRYGGRAVGRNVDHGGVGCGCSSADLYLCVAVRDARQDGHTEGIELGYGIRLLFKWIEWRHWLGERRVVGRRGWRGLGFVDGVDGLESGCRLPSRVRIHRGGGFFPFWLTVVELFVG